MNSTIRASIVSTLLALATLFSLSFSFIDRVEASSQHIRIEKRSSGYKAAPSNSAVLTYKNDNQRTGQDPNETILTTSNLGSGLFGKRIAYPVDGQVYAQPLYLPNVVINGTAHNIVFAATEHDSVYAFDADLTGSAPPLWKTSFLVNGATTVSTNDVQCSDLSPEMGITSTPVIDSSTNTLYVVAFTKEGSNLIYRLHALDVTTGLEKTGSPIRLQASVQGNGAGSVNGTIALDEHRERQRAALMLANGQVYMAFASFCDNDPYHGWVLGYTYNGTAFTQSSVYNDTANGTRGGIWGAAGALAADSSGNVFFMSGNGTFNLNSGGTEAGDSFGKMSAQLKLTDYFTPFNQSCLESADADLGSGGPLLLSAAGEVIGAGKEGRLYVLNASNLGKYTAFNGNPCTNQNLTNVDKIVQEFPPRTTGGIFSTPSYWNGSSGQFVYFTGSTDHAKAFSLSNGLLSSKPTSQTPESFGFPGGNAVVSSNGATSGTGIVWIIDPGAVLRAYDATNLANELYDSTRVPARDALDSYVKFSVATVANGEVFVGTRHMLNIFGENPPVSASFNNIGISDDTNPKAANYDGVGYSYSAQALKGVGIAPGGTVNFSNVYFTWPNVSSGTLDNWEATRQMLPVTPVSGADTLAFLGSATHGATSGVATITYTDSTTQTFTLGFTDWANGTLSFGNKIVTTMSYRNGAGGKQTINVYVFYAQVTLQSGKTIQSVTLPASVSGGELHVFAIGTKNSATPAFNNIGITDDSNTKPGQFDLGGRSYSAQALQGAGIKQGGTVTFNGVTFAWPPAASGTRDNYLAGGQIIPIVPVSGATRLAFLGSAAYGPSSGTATITYTDGTTQTFTLGLSDWTLNGGTVPPSFGNAKAATMSYRNTQTGKQTLTTYVFYTDVALQAGKTVKSVTLPSSVNQGQIHIFAVGTK